MINLASNFLTAVVVLDKIIVEKIRNSISAL
jgi:hypothetical protein